MARLDDARAALKDLPQRVKASAAVLDEPDVQYNLAVLLEEAPGEFKDLKDRCDGNKRELVSAAKAARANLRIIKGGNQPLMDDRPQVLVHTDEHVVNREAAAALTARSASLYLHGPHLAHVVDGAIRPIPAALLRDELAACARFVTRTETGEVRGAFVPDFTVKALASPGYPFPGVRQLRAVVTVPQQRRDGTLLDVPGYDEDTQLLYLPEGDFPAVAEHPSKADALAARDELLALIEEFPITGDEGRAVWLSLLLSCFAPYARPAPHGLVEASTRGSGKTLLCDVIGIIVRGRPLPRMPYSSLDEEMAKVITSLAIEGCSLVFFDNVTGVLGGAKLDAAWTGTSWQGRRLGYSETTGDLPFAPVWLSTANNATLSPDTPRRTIHVRLEPVEARPEDRQDFSIPRLLEHVAEHRGRYVRAALTILRGYAVAGWPQQDTQTIGMFEAWCPVQNAVRWVELPDPAASRLELAKFGDRDGNALLGLLETWPRVGAAAESMTAAEILLRVDRMGHEEFRAAVLEFAGAPNGKHPSSVSLGNKLSHARGRVVESKELDARVRLTNGKRTKGGYPWTVETITTGVAGVPGEAIPTNSTRESHIYGPVRAVNVTAPGDLAGDSRTSFTSYTAPPSYSEPGEDWEP